MSIPETVSDVVSRNKRSSGPSSGVRPNKKPAYIAGIVFVVFVMGIFYASTKRGQQIVEEAVVEKEFNLDPNPIRSVSYLDNKPDGLAGVDKSLFSNEEEDTGRAERESDIDDRIAQAIENQKLDELSKNKQLQDAIMKERFESAQQAYRGGLSVGGFGDRYDKVQQRYERAELDMMNAQIIPASSTEDNISEFMRQFNQPGASSASQQHMIDQMAAGANGRPQELYTSQSVDTTSVNESRAYLNSGARSDFRLPESVENPPGKFALMTGTLVPAMMISAANSDLPGDIVAQVSQNIYDTRTGRYLLIPQGTKLFGRYDAFTSLGQSRLLIAWDRLVFPDTQTLAIGGMQGYDGRGMSGMKDKLNTHFLKTLGNTFLLSAVNGAADSLIDSATNENAFIANIQTSFGGASQSAIDQYLANRLKIKPTIEIRAGYQFNIIVSKDITFPAPYEYGYTTLNSWR